MTSSMGTPQQPKARVKKVSRDPVVVMEEAARLGDATFQYFVETGRLERSESKSQPKTEFGKVRRFK